MAEDLPHTEQQMESLETNPLSYQADPNERFRWSAWIKIFISSEWSIQMLPNLKVS